MAFRAAGVFLLLLATAWPAADAQDFGMKIGISYSELREEQSGLAPLTGFNAGAFAAFPVYKHWSVLTEGAFYRKGYDAGEEWRNAENVVIGSDVNKHADYASVLVAAQYQAAWGEGGLDFYALLGPRVDALLAERYVATIDGDRETVEYPSSFQLPAFNAVVFGVTAGVGIDLRNAFVVPLLVELRYNADATPAWTTRSSDFRFRTIDLRLGYSF